MGLVVAMPPEVATSQGMLGIGMQPATATCITYCKALLQHRMDAACCCTVHNDLTALQQLLLVSMVDNLGGLPFFL
jgi:hypothetical protein